MKYSSIFKEKINCSNASEVFSYLINNLNESIRYWDYFVNWNKVLGNTRDIEIDLTHIPHPEIAVFGNIE